MLRYKRFWEKVTSSITTDQVRSLSPTSAPAKYHSLRVYLQVQRRRPHPQKATSVTNCAKNADCKVTAYIPAVLYHILENVHLRRNT
ncbi:hypothetical protein PoB_007518000 [Plakobranchus ocellatus]|uniref:Uncharacterized protein n=1 Tax=Plakobranchus ocellatus TaxID=259542 RepID=A0AAV4DXA1_9GAST|nr:hypothetical protein PoB_007518000 [Plakobranchus ocellatus]